MYYCCSFPAQRTLIENLSSISTILTAIASFALAYYVFIYQRRKDNQERIERNKEIHRNVRLQWFKDAIIQPNLKDIYVFYSKVHRESAALHAKNLRDEQKKIAIDKIKSYCYDFRKSFIDLIGAVDKDIKNKVQERLDVLLDTLTINVFDEGINLSHGPAYNEKIEKPINDCKTSLFTILFNYEGHQV